MRNYIYFNKKKQNNRIYKIQPKTYKISEILLLINTSKNLAYFSVRMFNKVFDSAHKCNFLSGDLQPSSITTSTLSPPQRLLFFKKPRKRGKGGKKGKAEKRERRKNGKGGKTGKAEKAREKGKSEESLCLCRYPTAHSLSAG